jgi:hypothetical protein
VKGNIEFEKIIERMRSEFCPDCQYLCKELDEGEQCSFVYICTKSLSLLKKHKPLYFKPSK